MSFCPPQIQNDLTWDQTRAEAMGIGRITARDMVPPSKCYRKEGQTRNDLKVLIRKLEKWHRGSSKMK
jgi:hypothetical protein